MLRSSAEGNPFCRLARTDGPQAQTVEPLSYRDFLDCNHPKRENRTINTTGLRGSLPGLTPPVGSTRLAAHNAAHPVQARVAVQSILIVYKAYSRRRSTRGRRALARQSLGLTARSARATSIAHEHNQ